MSKSVWSASSSAMRSESSASYNMWGTNSWNMGSDGPSAAAKYCSIALQMVMRKRSSSKGMCTMLKVMTVSSKNGHSPTYFTASK